LEREISRQILGVVKIKVKIKGVSTASRLNIFGKTVDLKIFVNVATKRAIQHHLAMLQALALRWF
jgi:hypothetical protein